MELKDVENFHRGYQMSDVLTIDEVADWLRVHRTSLYRWVKTGTIPHFKVGNLYRFNRASIEAWIRSESENGRG